MTGWNVTFWRILRGSGEAKLNSAYAEGSANLNHSKVLDIDIDYYTDYNMQGMIDLVDAVGGIEVTNHFDFPISIAKNEHNFRQRKLTELIKSMVLL